MEQPTLLSAANNGGDGGSGGGGSGSSSDTIRRKQQQPPTPEELVALYESQGLDSRDASLKAIGDLQAVLYRTIVSARNKNQNTTTDTARKLDNLNTRLAIIDTKLDAKPGYPESLAIGLASGAAPHLLGALRNIWNAVTGNLDQPPSSSS